MSSQGTIPVTHDPTAIAMVLNHATRIYAEKRGLPFSRTIYVSEKEGEEIRVSEDSITLSAGLVFDAEITTLIDLVIAKSARFDKRREKMRRDFLDDTERLALEHFQRLARNDRARAQNLLTEMERIVK